jgi:hypothetical protein
LPLVRAEYNTNLDDYRFAGIAQIINNITLVAMFLTGAAVIRVVDLYWKPNVTDEQVRAVFTAPVFDPLKAFSSACRGELQKLASVA